MRTEIVTEIILLAKRDKRLVFLTGDLGFNAFEHLREILGKRFINAGVAEQNMIDVAAGMARMGLHPWVYSIAPFLTLKAFEQVRNNICHPNLPVKFLGNGGGYGYGIMGETHHALEDVAIFSALPNIKIFAPAFKEDIPSIVKIMSLSKTPSYARLNLLQTSGIKKFRYGKLRKIREGKKLTVIVLGYLVHNVLKGLESLRQTNAVDLWCVTEIPFTLSTPLLNSLRSTKKLLIIEEHGFSGGLGEKILAKLMKKKMNINTFSHLFARGYHSGLYGSHTFHLKENHLDVKGISRQITRML
ncbi:MAG: transketolase C-terminal domain-containing protein [bacterium]|nr:transketolase C-terminal domain-containing protein [bacterium]